MKTFHALCHFGAGWTATGHILQSPNLKSVAVHWSHCIHSDLACSSSNLKEFHCKNFVGPLCAFCVIRIEIFFERVSLQKNFQHAEKRVENVMNGAIKLRLSDTFWDT